tara:strand:- start:4653 stop:5306 length:654 start_codon:yes stop_codon:yes gene_type:complete
MISGIEGHVIYQNDFHVIIQTRSGLGYRVAFNKKRLERNIKIFLYTAQTFRENGQDLYGFDSVKDLEMFDLLCSVKGVGSKSAFSLVNSLGFKNVLDAISFDNKKLLSTAPGIGNKAASQIILDLQTKITKLSWVDDQKFSLNGSVSSESENEKIAISEDLVGLSQKNSELFVQDTLMACKDLGFKESEILPIISSVMKTGGINSSEELIQMVLKGL